MQLFPLIPSILTKISFLVPGIEMLLIVLQKEAEAGGMAAVVIVLFRRISTEFIRIVEIKPWPISIGINWIKTVPRAAAPHQLKWKLDQRIFLKLSDGKVFIKIVISASSEQSNSLLIQLWLAD